MRPAPSACSQCDPSVLPIQRALTDHAISLVGEEDGEDADWATPGSVVFSTERHGRTEDGPPSQSDRTEQEHLCTL